MTKMKSMPCAHINTLKRQNYEALCDCNGYLFPSAAIMQTTFSCHKLPNCISDSVVLDFMPRKQSDSFLVLLTWTKNV